MKKINRVFHHFEKMEEYKKNMWKQIPVEEREGKIQQSYELMKNYDSFYNAMKKAVDSWPYSCEANLTASVINHQAWLGHAGCAINHDAPEDLTRLAWSMLTKDEQDIANSAADAVKEYWKGIYCAKN